MASRRGRVKIKYNEGASGVTVSERPSNIRVDPPKQKRLSAKSLDGSVKLTPYKIKRICEVIKTGNKLGTAAAVVGISRSTLGEYLKIGTNPAHPSFHKIYQDLVEAVLLAEAESEQELVTRLVDHLKKKRPEAIINFLEKRFKSWAPEKPSVVGEGDENIKKITIEFKE